MLVVIVAVLDVNLFTVFAFDVTWNICEAVEEALPLGSSGFLDDCAAGLTSVQRVAIW